MPASSTEGTGHGSAENKLKPINRSKERSVFDDLMAKSGSPTGEAIEKKIICAISPPNKKHFWWNTLLQTQYYFHELSGFWLSYQMGFTVFNEPGDTANNTWFKIGNTRCNETRGYGSGFRMRLSAVSWCRGIDDSTGVLNIYSGNENQPATIVDSVMVNDKSADMMPVMNNAVINENDFISPRWSGQNTDNWSCTVLWRHVWHSNYDF